MLRLVAAEAVHRAGEVREALEVAAALKGRSAHRWGKTHHLRPVRRAEAADQTLEGIDHALEAAAAAVEAVDAGAHQEALVEQAVEEARDGACGLVEDVGGAGFGHR